MGSFSATLTLFTLTVLFTVAQSQENIRIKRRMYAMCPPKFQRIGSECYAISDQPANWLEAHFQCKDKNSKLAEPNSKSDRKLRAFFQRMDHDTDEIWIGATFDWHINTWQWSISGKNLSYDAFSRLDPESRKSLEYHCAVLNPSLKYRWSARSCVDKHRYICQHKMPKVSEKNRFKVYDRWNQTYPNQLANEVEMEIIDTKSKDGKRTNRRVKPVDSGENYAIPPRRPTQAIKQRRRPHVPPKETSISNDINVKFIPNYLTNEINGDLSYQTTPKQLDFLPMDFIPADMGNIQANQAYVDTTTKRPRNPTNAPPSRDNETVDHETKPLIRTTPQGRRARTKFDKLNEEKRKQERERKRAEHRRRKQMRLQEKERRRQEEEARKKQDEERRKLENERKAQEEERKKQEQMAIEELKLKQAEEEKRFRDQEESEMIQRQKLQEQLEQSRKEQEQQAAEERILKEKREEEEEQMNKERLHEQKRLQLEFEQRLKQQQDERERKLEEEKQLSEANRRRAEEEEAKRLEDLKRHQEEDEKRLELQRIEKDREQKEQELQRLEKENQKRIAAQKARDEEIRRREEALAAELAKEKLLEEELRKQEEQDRLQHEQELKKDIEERERKEEAERLERERKEEQRKKKAEKNKVLIESEAKKLEEMERKEKIRKYAERISRLSPEMQRKFIEARRNRQKKKNADNEASIPERK